jgi:hypothetical protein
MTIRTLPVTLLLLAACASPRQMAEGMRIEVGRIDGDLTGERSGDIEATSVGLSWSPFAPQPERHRCPDPREEVAAPETKPEAVPNLPAPIESTPEPAPAASCAERPERGVPAPEPGVRDTSSPLTLPLWVGNASTVLLVILGAWASWKKARCYRAKRKSAAALQDARQHGSTAKARIR